MLISEFITYDFDINGDFEKSIPLLFLMGDNDAFKALFEKSSQRVENAVSSMTGLIFPLDFKQRIVSDSLRYLDAGGIPCRGQLMNSIDELS